MRALGIRRIAGRNWAFANALFAAGSLVTVLRPQWPQPWVFAAGDSLELAGLACLQGVLHRFLGSAWPRREQAWALGPAVPGLFAAYALHWPAIRLTIYCAAAAWLLGRAVRPALRGLRDEFGPHASLIVAGPLILASALEVTRGAGGLFADGTKIFDSLQPTQFNIVLAWATFAIALLLNFAVIGFAGARQLTRIHELTLRDPLTGALNRRALEHLLKRELASRHRHGLPLALIYFDLDHFKALNDRYGHAAGDAALRHAVNVVGRACREGDSVARAGGEEFCVVLPYTGLEGACLMAERMRRELEASRLDWDGLALTLTASFGVACSESLTERVSDLLREGDRAMYAAKAIGRNCVSEAPREECDAAAGDSPLSAADAGVTGRSPACA